MSSPLMNLNCSYSYVSIQLYIVACPLCALAHLVQFSTLHSGETTYIRYNVVIS